MIRKNEVTRENAIICKIYPTCEDATIEKYETDIGQNSLTLAYEIQKYSDIGQFIILE